MNKKIIRIPKAHSLIFFAFLFLTSTSQAGQASGWWSGSWKCTIDRRPAKMKWVLVNDDNTPCNGDDCTTSSGVKWKGSFSDNGSKWVSLTNLEKENDDDIYFTHADGNQWYLPKPENNITKGNTTWNNQKYDLICERQLSPDNQKPNMATKKSKDIKYTKSVLQDKSNVRMHHTPSNISIATTPPDQNVSKPTDIKRGFDEKGKPYVDYIFSDGTRHRKSANRMTIFFPDGKSRDVPYQSFLINAQPPSPPSLPTDPKFGKLWMENHNDGLRNIIQKLVNNDESAMKKFDAAESKTAGNNLFNQITYRTKVLEVLAQP